jgi:8-oxo-dGTP diphosphatase
MSSIAARIWSWPWPRRLRRSAEGMAALPLLRRVVFPQFTVGVAGVIENDKGEVLLVRHTYRRRYPWGLPGGFLEHHERPNEALKREIREEAGLEVDLQPEFQIEVDTKRPHVSIIFRGTCRGGSFVPNPETSAAAFFRIDQLPTLVPEQRQMIESQLQEVSH